MSTSSHAAAASGLPPRQPGGYVEPRGKMPSRAAGGRTGPAAGGARGAAAPDTQISFTGDDQSPGSAGGRAGAEAFIGQGGAGYQPLAFGAPPPAPGQAPAPAPAPAQAPAPPPMAPAPAPASVQAPVPPAAPAPAPAPPPGAPAPAPMQVPYAHGAQLAQLQAPPDIPGIHVVGRVAPSYPSSFQPPYSALHPPGAPLVWGPHGFPYAPQAQGV